METNAIIIATTPPPTRQGPLVDILEAIPAHRFPNIWEQIFDNLTKLDDLLNAMETHADWKLILESVHMRSKRKIWLFPKIFPLLCKYLGRHDVLNLRRTCSGWSQGVDLQIEEGCCRFPSDDFGRRLDRFMRNQADWRPGDMRFPYTISGFNYPTDVDDFIEGMRAHPRNPIVGRGLVIEFDDMLYAETVRGANRFLPVFGHHLTSLKLKLEESEMAGPIPGRISLGGFIQSVLSHTPNLAQLEVSRQDEYFQDPTGEMEVIQLPPLNRLRTLQLDYNDFSYGMSQPRRLREFTQALALLRAYSSQLTRFGVDGVDAAHWTGLNWPELTELHVRIGSRSRNILSSLVNLKAPQLSALIITTDEMSSGEVQELLRVISHFPKLEPSGVTIRSIF